MMSASTPLREPAPLPDETDQVICEWTDEELNALTDEADAEGGESVEGSAFIASLISRVRARSAGAP